MGWEIWGHVASTTTYTCAHRLTCLLDAKRAKAIRFAFMCVVSEVWFGELVVSKSVT